MRFNLTMVNCKITKYASVTEYVSVNEYASNCDLYKPYYYWLSKLSPTISYAMFNQ